MSTHRAYILQKFPSNGWAPFYRSMHIYLYVWEKSTDKKYGWKWVLFRCKNSVLCCVVAKCAVLCIFLYILSVLVFYFYCQFFSYIKVPVLWIECQWHKIKGTKAIDHTPPHSTQNVHSNRHGMSTTHWSKLGPVFFCNKTYLIRRRMITRNLK